DRAAGRHREARRSDPACFCAGPAGAWRGSRSEGDSRLHDANVRRPQARTGGICGARPLRIPADYGRYAAGCEGIRERKSATGRYRSGSPEVEEGFRSRPDAGEGPMKTLRLLLALVPATGLFGQYQYFFSDGFVNYESLTQNWAPATNQYYPS